MLTPEMMNKMKMLKDKMMGMKDKNPQWYSDAKPHEDYLDKMMGECKTCWEGEMASEWTTVSVSFGEDKSPMMQKFKMAVDMLEEEEQGMILNMKDTRSKLSPEGQKVAMLLWKIYAMWPEKNADLDKRMTDYESWMGESM